MYSSKGNLSSDSRFYEGKDDGKKVYANTLRSDGGYDTLSRASEADTITIPKSVRFDDRKKDGESSVLKRPDNDKYFYQSPFKTAAKMM